MQAKINNGKWCSPYQTGLVLIIVMVFLLLTASFSVHLVMQGTRVVKMVGNLQEQWRENLVLENTLIEKEQALSKLIRDSSYEQHAYYAFVADTLGFGCDTGMMIFKVEAPPFVSFWQERLQ